MSDTNTQQRLAYIDALRGFAILAVIFNHTGTLVSAGGWLGRLAMLGAYGVQLFFVVSAFTIFLTFDRARQREAHPVKNFFTRRLMRIVPLYWGGILLYTAVYGVGSRGWLGAPELWHYPVHLTLTNVLHPLTQSSVVPGGWSISAEVLFYLTVPLWFALVRTLKGALIFVAACVLLGPAAASLMQMGLAGMFADIPAQLMQLYWLRSYPSQLVSFGLGILLYYVLRETSWRVRPRTAALLLVASAAAVIGWERLGLNYPYVAPVYPAAFCVVAFALASVPFRFLINRATIFFGRISYSAYLVHFLVLRELHDVIQPSGSSGFVLLFGLALVLTAAFAFVLFHVVETPCIGAARRWIARREARQELTPATAS